MGVYDYKFNPTPTPGNNTTSIRQLVPARVVDVILEPNHPEFKKYGEYGGVGTIKYRKLSSTENENNTTTLPAAFPLQSHIKHIPLKDEIVLILSAPTPPEFGTNSNTKNYYIDIVNLWNHPHHNAYPSNDAVDPNLDTDFTELSDINPMRPFTGDIILEGRQGQSIRFSTGIENKTPWIGQNGNPITVISNGQKTTEEGFTYITEDINEDSTSIYLTADQGVPLEHSNNWTFDTVSIRPPEFYNNPQLLVNSERVLLNGRDSVVLTGTNHILLNAKHTYLEGDNTVTLESTRINLGVDAQESVVLGDTMLQKLSSVLTEVNKLGLALGKIGIPDVSIAAGEVVRTTSDFLSNISKMKSNKVKVAKNEPV